MRTAGMARIVAFAAGMAGGAFVAGPAAAQVWEVGVDGDWTGSVACSADQFGCVAIGCDAGSPLRLDIWFGEMERLGFLIQGETAVGVVVDGRPAGTLTMVFDPAGEFWTSPLGDDSAGIIAALQAGNRAEIGVAAAVNGEEMLPLGLSGSGAALRAVMATCPMAAAGEVAAAGDGGKTVVAVAPAPEATAAGARAVSGDQTAVAAVPALPSGTAQPRVFPNGASGAVAPDPEAVIVARMQEECGGADGTQIDEFFASRSDLDGDGLEDVIFDYGGAFCREFGPLYCGSAGCLTEVWLGRPDGAYAQVFAGYAQMISPAAPGVIEFGFHGGECGMAGAAACGALMRVEGGVLVPAG